MRERRSWSTCALIFVLVACGPPPRRDDGNGGVDGSVSTDADFGPDGNNGCPAGTELVYVVDNLYNKISSFDPSNKTFADMGQLFCPTMGGATPFSMGVDRNGIAWVLYTSGELFHVDLLHSLTCTKTTWMSSGGMTTFGMGFTTDTPGGTTDSLYIGGTPFAIPPVTKLAKVDTTTMTATMIGNVPALPEMTGNSKAELWGFMPDASMPKVVQFDKTNGMAITTFNLPTLAGGMAGYAFAHWGGDYWVFLQRNGEPQSSVYQVDGTTGMVKSTTVATGRTIVGAGVSTCAPIVIM